MRLRHIEIFYNVYRLGSISGAARDLNVSQPSVSKVLRHAEDQLGYALFDRVRGRLTPTPEADQLYAEVEDVYRRIRSLDQTAKNIRARKGGHIRLGALPSLGLRVAPEAIAAFRKSRPGVTFEINTLHSREVSRALFERECDVTIGYGAPYGSGIVSHKLGMIELVLVAPKGALDPSPDGVDISVLDGVDFIGFRDSGPTGELFTNRLMEHEVEPREVVTARTYYVALQLVQLGLGLSVVDNFTAASVPNPEFAVHRFRNPIRFPVNAAMLEDHPQSVLVADFLKLLGKTVLKFDPERARLPA